MDSDEHNITRPDGRLQRHPVVEGRSERSVRPGSPFIESSAYTGPIRASRFNRTRRARTGRLTDLSADADHRRAQGASFLLASPAAVR